MIDAHLRMLRQRHPISADEERAIRGLVAESRQVRRDRHVVHAGDLLNESLVLVDGWLARAKTLREGQRQVSHLHVAGDFADLHGYSLKRLDHDLVAMTDCRLAVIPHDRLDELFARHPRLERVYWFSTNLDAALHREWTLSLGRRSAVSRLAHLFCELQVRLSLVGLASDDGYDFPLTQENLAECLGMTSVHVNRSLQDLRGRGVIRVESRRVTILDQPHLARIADFDPGYLYPEGPRP